MTENGGDPCSLSMGGGSEGRGSEECVGQDAVPGGDEEEALIVVESAVEESVGGAGGEWLGGKAACLAQTLGKGGQHEQ